MRRIVPALLVASLLLGSDFLGSGLAAQLREPGTPASFRAQLPKDIPMHVFARPDVKSVRSTDDSEWAPFRYGIELDLDRGLTDAGRWDRVEATGELVWRLELVSPGAFSLGVFFSQFDLPHGAQVFLYDPAHREVLGAYGESTENPNGTLAIQPLRGDAVVIEYVEPPGVRETPKLRIGTVVHDYLDILAHMAQGSVMAASCLIDVNCPQGAAHQDMKRAVVWMVRSGVGCSGSILNNTAEDGTPYMMTAEHCGDMSTGVFIFDYERSGCAAGASSQSKSLSGATQLAVSAYYDGQLYRLNQSPPASYEPFFAGWTRSTTVPADTFGISHPSGDPKKISIDHQPPLLTSTRWNVLNDAGAVQPGSSGSPLFGTDERIRGTCSSGGGFCGQNLASYGRFDSFYATCSLATWLDPLGWNQDGIDGFDPVAPYTQPYLNDSTDPELYSSLTEPRLGTTWKATIDASLHTGATSTLIIAYPRPAQAPTLALGTLLVDVGTPRIFQHSSAVTAGSSEHDFALPASAGLAGFVAYTQAIVFGGGMSATNGLKVVLNF